MLTNPEAPFSKKIFFTNVFILKVPISPKIGTNLTNTTDNFSSYMDVNFRHAIVAIEIGIVVPWLAVTLIIGCPCKYHKITLLPRNKYC